MPAIMAASSKEERRRQGSQVVRARRESEDQASYRRQTVLQEACTQLQDNAIQPNTPHI
jgi:hypothetical protein